MREQLVQHLFTLDDKLRPLTPHIFPVIFQKVDKVILSGKIHSESKTSALVVVKHGNQLLVVRGFT